MARLTKAQREAAAAATGEAPSASTSASSTAPVGAAVADAAEDTLADVAGEDILDEAESNGNSGAKRTKPRGTSLLTNAGPRAKSRSSGAAAAARSSPSVGAAAANEDNEYSSSAAGAAGSAGAGARRARSASESEMSTSEGSSAGDEEDQLAAAGAAGDDSRVDGGGDDDDSMVGGTAESPEVKCMWEDCGMTFTSLQPFINHLHDDHVGIHKARYACEWTGCPRKGKAQTSRFALLSHLRSHTGEKPFTCPRPECDKSFTRSDALAKHMRVQHNINPTTSRGRGSAKDTTQGSGGRASRVKGEEDDDWASGSAAEGGAGLGGAGGSGDALDDELLGLAEGPASGMDLDQSLTLNGAASAAFTYENLFETGASADAKDKGPRGDTGELDGPLSIVAGLPMTDEELGIVRDQKISSNVLLNDEDVDEEALAKEHKEMDQVLEMARREWVRREREKAKIRREEEKLRAPQEEAVPPPPLSSATTGADEEMVDAGLAETNGKRPATSYDSEEEAAGAEGGSKNSNALVPSPPASKRPRRASQRNLHASSTAEEHSIGTTRSASKSALVTAQQTAEATKLTKVYLIEKAKLRLVKDENARLKAELERLRVEERWEKGDKRKLLERCLEAELGRDVGAIFSPPPSPGPGAAP